MRHLPAFCFLQGVLSFFEVTTGAAAAPLHHHQHHSHPEVAYGLVLHGACPISSVAVSLCVARPELVLGAGLEALVHQASGEKSNSGSPDFR